MSSENRAKSSSEKDSVNETRWSIRDVIDLEYAIRLASKEAPDRIQALEASVRTSIIDPLDNRTLLKIWLDRVRSELFSPLWSPGSVFDFTTAFGHRAALLLFFVIGATLARSLLQYQGAEPVNVSAFIALLILLQFGLALISVILCLFPSKAGRPLDYALGLRIAQPIALHFAQTLARYAGSRLDAAHRNTLELAAGDVKRIWNLYRPLFRWSLFTKLQEWSLAFNVGALLATLLSILFSDRAFGWQTTLQIDAESIYQIVRATATPWAWFLGEGVGYPSLEEIAGSRITLKDGIRALNSENLVSWWPYLSLGIVCYGILPRIVFRSWGRFKTSRALNALSFSHNEARHIAERIRGLAAPFQSSSPSRPSAPTEAIEHSRDLYLGSASPLGGVCLIASDLYESPSDNSLQDAIRATLSNPTAPLELKQLTEEEMTDPELLDLGFASPNGPVSIVFDSWMPPIEESKRLIKAVRSKLKEDAKISIILLGPLDMAHQRSLPTTQNIQVWSHFIRKLGDPYCSVEPLQASE